MKRFVMIFILGLCSITLFSQNIYSGLERIFLINDKGKPKWNDKQGKWYHLNTLLIENDSLFIYKVPVQIEKKDTLYSASDGAFYYYYGRFQQINSDTVSILTMYNCDYCGMPVRTDSITGFMFPIPQIDTLKVAKRTNEFVLENVTYRISNKQKTYFPEKQMFYLDSNSIYRVNPKDQYRLISQGIKNFIQTEELKHDNDTFIVSLDRVDGNKIIETLKPEFINIYTSGLAIKYCSLSDLNSLVRIKKQIVRYVEIGKIIDYWSAARISLTYKILIPETVSGFKEQQYNCLMEYKKNGMNYSLMKDYIQKGWQLIEQ
jgi:hypothetical protein